MRGPLSTTLLSALLLIPACGGDTMTGDPTEDLLKKVRDMDYRSWDRPADYPGLAESDAPHGGYTEIFINDVVAQALAAGGASEWPVGSIIVKDGWDDAEGTQRAILAIMERRSEGENGWYWEEYVGEELSRDWAGQSPDPEVCTGCHAAGSDYVRAFSLP